MLDSQLCMFDDKTDSKSKWVKKLMVWFVVLIIYFAKIPTCDALITI